MSKTQVDEQYTALSLENKGKEAEKRLLDSLRQTSLFSMCYAYKSRVKSESKILEKKVRKTQDKPHYGIKNITDIIGIRFVTLFRAEMPDVVKEIISLIVHAAELSPNPFLKKHIEEIIIFSTNIGNDPVVGQIKNILKPFKLENGGKLKLEQSKEGYSSIHIVTRLTPKQKIKGIKSDPGYYIPVEIQVRTVFEDAWGEIDHKYGYVIRTGKSTKTSIHNPESVLPHLQVLKKFSDACAEYADVIHKEATEDSSKRVDSSNIISVGSDKEIITRLRSLGASKGFVKKYTDARISRQKGEALIRSSAADAVLRLNEAAQEFKEMADEFVKNKPPSKDDKKNYLIYYYSKMNEAFCLLSTNKNEDISAAQTIYHHLEITYPDFPLVKYRIGQAFGMLGNLDRCIEELNNSMEMVKHLEKKRSVGSDELPTVDHKHVLTRLPLVLGYNLWKKTQIEGISKSQQLKILDKALKLTKRLHETDNLEVKFKAYNNLLYYSMDKYNLLKDLKKPTLSTKKNIAEYLKQLGKNKDIKECSKLYYLDTISKAYFILDRVKDAKKTADIIISNFLEKIGLTQPPDLEFDNQIVREAKDLLENLK